MGELTSSEPLAAQSPDTTALEPQTGIPVAPQAPTETVQVPSEQPAETTITDANPAPIATEASAEPSPPPERPYTYETSLIREPEIKHVEKLLEEKNIVAVSGDIDYGKSTMLSELGQYFQGKGRVVHNLDGHVFQSSGQREEALRVVDGIIQWVDGLPEVAADTQRPVLLFDSGDYLAFHPAYLSYLALDYDSPEFHLIKNLGNTPEAVEEYLRAREQARLAERAQRDIQYASYEMARTPQESQEIWQRTQAEIQAYELKSRTDDEKLIPRFVQDAPFAIAMKEKQVTTIEHLAQAVLDQKIQLVLSDHDYSERLTGAGNSDATIRSIYMDRLRNPSDSTTFYMPAVYTQQGRRMYLQQCFPGLPGTLVDTIAQETRGLHSVLTHEITPALIEEIRNMPQEDQQQKLKDITEKALVELRQSQRYQQDMTSFLAQPITP